MNEKKLDKTLAQLDDYFKSIFEYDSYLVKTVNQLADKKLKQFQ